MGKTAVLILALLMLCGCTKRVYVPTESVRTEYKDRVVEKVVYDSITDTRYVFVKGDTIIDYRDRIRWREKLVHDTVAAVKVDTIRLPTPYEVDTRLTPWQEIKMRIGGFAIGLITLALSALIVWLIRKGMRLKRQLY